MPLRLTNIHTLLEIKYTALPMRKRTQREYYNFRWNSTYMLV